MEHLSPLLSWSYSQVCWYSTGVLSLMWPNKLQGPFLLFLHLSWELNRVGLIRSHYFILMIELVRFLFFHCTIDFMFHCAPFSNGILRHAFLCCAMFGGGISKIKIIIADLVINQSQSHFNWKNICFNIVSHVFQLV